MLLLLKKQGMLELQKIFPVSRVGNEKSPRLVVLLCNPGGDPKYYKRLDEYPMNQDGIYKSSGMNLHKCREYCEWWDNFLNKTDKFGIKDTEILALEYYPYHSPNVNSSKDWIWDEFAIQSLAQNKKLLLKHIAHGVPVFGYYYGLWVSKKDKELYNALSQLNDVQFHKSKNARGQPAKLKDLENWLSKIGKII